MTLANSIGSTSSRISHKFFQKFREFQNLVERLFVRKIPAGQTDWGGEYQKLHPFFKDIGIYHHV
jgi:hypothetical protein